MCARQLPRALPRVFFNFPSAGRRPRWPRTRAGTSSTVLDLVALAAFTAAGAQQTPHQGRLAGPCWGIIPLANASADRVNSLLSSSSPPSMPAPPRRTASQLREATTTQANPTLGLSQRCRLFGRPAVGRALRASARRGPAPCGPSASLLTRLGFITSLQLVMTSPLPQTEPDGIRYMTLSQLH